VKLNIEQQQQNSRVEGRGVDDAIVQLEQKGNTSAHACKVVCCTQNYSQQLARTTGRKHVQRHLLLLWFLLLLLLLPLLVLAVVSLQLHTRAHQWRHFHVVCTMSSP
jgi:glycine/D-amino acid oxidase-like deaminating enzyme